MQIVERWLIKVDRCNGQRAQHGGRVGEGEVDGEEISDPAGEGVESVYYCVAQGILYISECSCYMLTAPLSPAHHDAI